MATRETSGKSRPFPQQVHPNQHVKVAVPQILNQLNPFNGMNFGVQIPHPHILFVEVFGQVFGHALSQRGH
jgi:hypothetical protein